MKAIKFLFSALLTLAVTIVFSIKIDQVPPLGKFFNPFGGFWANSEKEAISAAPNLQVNGLKDEVTVQFDQYLIPHIFANNDEDLYFAQGYVTAFHRLWSMEFQLLAAAGRISELLGPAAIDFDRGNRRMGLTYGARRKLKHWKQDTTFFKIISAYSRGVNAYISDLQYSDYPLEYKLLDYQPEPWSEYKTCLLLMLMSQDLSLNEADLENTNALKLFGKEAFDFLFPELPPSDDLDPVIPKGTAFDFQPIEVNRPDSLKVPLRFTKRAVESPDPRNGSNNFAVGPTKTGNGALLANEPDLALNLPSIWYIAHLVAPGVNSFGASLPGAPSIIIGHNENIAWGETNAKRDLADWFYIEFRTKDRKEYKYDNHWLKTEQVIETFKVRGAEDVTDTIVFTHYGPVVYDRQFEGNGEKINLALRWTAHDPSDEFLALYKLNRATNFPEFMEALDYWDGPPQNFAYADREGNVGLRIAGKFPVKWRGQGKFIMDGRIAAHDWQADMPNEHELYTFNPDRGFVSSANQHPVDSLYPYYSYDFTFEHYRGRRINDRLNILNSVSPDEMKQLQNDNFNYKAYESLPMMLDSLDTAAFDSQKLEIYRLMKSWDYFNTVDSKAASVYKLWSGQLYKLLWDEFENQPEMTLMRPHTYNTIHILNNYPNHPFVDNKNTPEIEDSRALSAKAFNLAIDSLNNWMTENGEDYSWYLFKNTRINHLTRVKEFSFEQVPVGGDNNIVNAASGRHGPSWRMVVQLTGEGVKTWGVYPGSQSGNPGNPKYGHMIADWASGQYYDMLFPSSPMAASEQILLTQKMQPAK